MLYFVMDKFVKLISTQSSGKLKGTSFKAKVQIQNAKHELFKSMETVQYLCRRTYIIQYHLKT